MRNPLARIGLLVAALFCSHAPAADPAPAAKALTPVKIALDWKPEPEFGGFYAAQVNGDFAIAGLEATILPGGSGTPIPQMLAAGTVDFGIVSGDQLVNLRSKGGDIVALFAVYQTSPQGLLTGADRNITSLKQLLETPGTVAWEAGLPYVAHFKKLYNLSQLKQVPYTGGLPFLNGTNVAQQCFVTSEPLLAEKQGHKVSSFLIAESGYNPYTTVLAVRGEYLRQHADLCRAVTAAVRAGWQGYLADATKTNEVMRKLNPSMDAATFAASAEAQKKLIETEETKADSIGSMTETRWQTLIDQLKEYKVITAPVKASDCFVSPK